MREGACVCVCVCPTNAFWVFRLCVSPAPTKSDRVAAITRACRVCQCVCVRARRWFMCDDIILIISYIIIIIPLADVYYCKVHTLSPCLEALEGKGDAGSAAATCTDRDARACRRRLSLLFFFFNNTIFRRFSRSPRFSRRLRRRAKAGGYF